jgi:hypothetical protein
LREVGKLRQIQALFGKMGGLLAATIRWEAMNIHRCEALETAQSFHQEQASVPASPLAISLTRFVAQAWVLQLCRAPQDLMVLVQFCPFCGGRLNEA